MANLNLNQALTVAEQEAIKRLDLDCLVKYVDRFTLSEAQLFGFKDVVFRYGMPYKFPKGEFGYILFGDVGIRNKPVPKPGDHRLSGREYETPLYTQEYGSFHEVESKVTNYYDRDKRDLYNSKFGFAFHISALQTTLTKFMDGMIMVMFVGTKAKTKKIYTQEWGKRYVHPDNGSNDGYKFYQSEGFGSINLSEVITKQKITEHPLYKKLDDINKALRNDARKEEIDVTQNNFFKTDGPKNNLTPGERKCLALYLKAEELIDKFLDQGYMDSKYKHKKESFEGFDKPVRASNLRVAFSRTTLRAIRRSVRLRELFTTGMNLNNISGVPIIESQLLDSDEFIIFDKDLIQSHIMQIGDTYRVDAYPSDGTKDFTYLLSFSVDLIDICGSVWGKLKA